MDVLLEHPLVTVIHGDSRDVLPTLPREAFQLLLTDPPYGVEQMSNRREVAHDLIANDGSDEESRAVVRDVLEKALRCIDQNRHCYIFGPAEPLDGLKVSAPAAIVWDKMNPSTGDLSLPWGPSHETIQFVINLWRHGGERGKMKTPVRARQGSVIRCPTATNLRSLHPTIKPVTLLRRLIEASTRFEELVLDPFAGSGSTGVAAILEGRKAVLIELRREYAETCVDRCRAAIAHVEQEVGILR